MANEVVKHHNDLNTVIMKMDSRRDEFLFCDYYKSKETKALRPYFDKHQLAGLANYSIEHNKRF